MMVKWKREEEKKSRRGERKWAENVVCGFPKGQARRSSEWLPSSAIQIR